MRVKLRITTINDKQYVIERDMDEMHPVITFIESLHPDEFIQVSYGTYIATKHIVEIKHILH